MRARIALAALVLSPVAAAQCEQGKLAPALIGVNDRIGTSVAVIDDLLLAGATGDDDQANGAGAVHVFSCPGIGCTELVPSKILASDGALGDSFGATLAASGDALAVAAVAKDVVDPGSGSSVNGAGQVYLFDRAGSAFAQTAAVSLPDPKVSDSLGLALALSPGFLVASTPGRNDGAGPFGAVHSFVRAGGGATFEQKVLPADPASSMQFGAAVAVRDELLVVGAPLDDDLGAQSGSVYLFERQGGSWVESQKLLASDGAAGRRFGTSVALAGDQIVVGSPLPFGAVYVFEDQGGGFTEVQQLAPSGFANAGEFGGAVAVDGDRMIVGAAELRPTPGDSPRGGAFVFERTAGVWSETVVLFASDGASGDELGDAVAIRGDRLLAGAPLHDTGGNANAGRAYAFSESGQSCFELFGAGCACGNGEVPLLEMFGNPTPGGSIELRLSNAPSNAPGLLVFGTPISLPLPNGCTQLVFPLLPLSTISTGFGGLFSAEFGLDASASTGISVSVQAAVIDLTAPGLFCVTNGATVVVI